MTDPDQELISLLLEQARAGDRAIYVEAALRSLVERVERRGEETVSVASLRLILDSAR